MSFNVAEKLREIYDCCEAKQFARAVDLQTEFEQHFIISTEADVEELFSTEALGLIFRFLERKSNSTTLNLLSLLQLFEEEAPRISDFINDHFAEFSCGIAYNIEEVEIRQFYAWCLLNLEPRGDTIQQLKMEILQMVLDTQTLSNAKLVGEYVQNAIQIIQLLPAFKLIEDSLAFIQEHLLSKYPFGLSEYVPKILKICENSDQFIARQFEQEVIGQIMDILGSARQLKRLQLFNELYLIQEITYFAFIDQNLQFFKLLDERQFYQKLLALAQQDLPHVVAFTKEIVHFYMQLFERLCFTPKDIQFGIDEINEILFLDKTNLIMHQIVEKMPDETAYLTYIQYNGFVPIKVRTTYIAMLIICLKEFYVDLNSLQWKYTSLFTKPNPEESRQLVQLNVDLPLYNALSEFLRYFLLAAKPALKLYKNDAFKHENYGKFLLDNVFCASYSVASEIEADNNEASDKFVENTWATLDEIGVRPLRPRKKKEVAKFQKYIGDIPVIEEAFSFAPPTTFEPAQEDPEDDGAARRNQLRLQTSYRKSEKGKKGLSIKLAEPSDSDADMLSPSIVSLKSDSDDADLDKLSINISGTPKFGKEKLFARLKNSSSSEESQLQQFRFCGLKNTSSDEDSDRNTKLTISIGKSHADKSGFDTGPHSSRSGVHSSDEDIEFAEKLEQFATSVGDNSQTVLSEITDMLHINEAVSVDVSMDCDHGDEPLDGNFRLNAIASPRLCVAKINDSKSNEDIKPREMRVLKINNDSTSDEDDKPRPLRSVARCSDDILDLSLGRIRGDDDFELQKSDST